MMLHLPDDVDIEVPVEHMVVKDSVFVPTLKPDETRTMMTRIADKLEIKLSFKTAVVDGYLGVVFWRIA